MCSGEIMKVAVLFFAGARERAGTARVDVILENDAASVRDAVDAACSATPNKVQLPSNVMFSRNGSYTKLSDAVKDGDEIAIIPPVSGGAYGQDNESDNDSDTCNVWITSDPIDADSVVDKVGSDSDGAVVVFHGVTRSHNDGRTVLHLEYEAYSPMAENTMLEIISEMKEHWGIGDVAVCHRVGRVDIGHTSMVLAVSAPHRKPAYEASLYFVDRLKQMVPIWKKEYFEGGEVWIGDTPG